MHPADIKAGSRYVLESGEVITVTALIWSKVYVEVYNEETGQWDHRSEPIHVDAILHLASLEKSR